MTTRFGASPSRVHDVTPMSFDLDAGLRRTEADLLLVRIEGAFATNRHALENRFFGLYVALMMFANLGMAALFAVIGATH